MLVLGIESSCDETALALVKDGRQVLSSIVASQVAVHATFGGVVPEIAAREHLKAIHPLFQRCLQEAGCPADAIDLIAVSQGPGLIGALLVGVSFAKGLASALGKPLVPVDHVHAHIHGALLGLDAGRQEDEQLFPCLALVVSGGHTNLYFMTDPCHLRLLAATADDACGECFDKVAKLLGLAYPGGPQIEKLARQGQAHKIPMPKMMTDKSKTSFSYSGLKTHMVYLCQKEGPFSGERLADLCAAFQEEAFGQLVRKIKQGMAMCPQPVHSLLVAGGVAANLRFRSMITETLPLKAYFPALTYCSDNAAMIAALGWHEYNNHKSKEQFHNPCFAWDAYSRYRYELVS